MRVKVALGLLPSDSLGFQSYGFNEIPHFQPLYGVDRLHKSWRVLVNFGLILAMFLTS